MSRAYRTGKPSLPNGAPVSCPPGLSAPSKASVMPAFAIKLCTQATDLRKIFAGLSALVKSQLGQNPLSGHYDDGSGYGERVGWADAGSPTYALTA